MAAGTEHDRDVRQIKPDMVVRPQMIDQVAHELVTLTGHHETDGEASGMSSGSDEFKASQRAQTTLARQIEIQHDALGSESAKAGLVTQTTMAGIEHTSISLQDHISQSINAFHGETVI